MNNKILYLIFIALIICSLVGCQHLTKEIVKIDYTPSRYSKITDATKTIDVNPLKDLRGVDPKLLCYKDIQGRKRSGEYLLERDVSDIVTEAIKKSLSNQNYRIAEERGDLTLAGEILKLESYLVMGVVRFQVEGNIQVNLRLTDNKNGNIVWTEIFGGYAKKNELQGDHVVYRKEVLENTLDNLISSISNSSSFRRAIERSD